MWLNDSLSLCSWPRKVEYWMTSDGRDFDSEEDALCHQKILNESANFRNCITLSTKTYD